MAVCERVVAGCGGGETQVVTNYKPHLYLPIPLHRLQIVSGDTNLGAGAGQLHQWGCHSKLVPAGTSSGPAQDWSHTACSSSQHVFKPLTAWREEDVPRKGSS